MRQIISGIICILIILLVLSLIFKIIAFLLPIIFFVICIIVIYYLIDKYILKKNNDVNNNIVVKTIEHELPISLDNAYDLFNPLMTKRGEDIDISSIKITKSKDKYSAIIDDYNVSTKIDDNMVKELNCSCTYKGYCKHQYALIKKIKK